MIGIHYCDGTHLVTCIPEISMQWQFHNGKTVAGEKWRGTNFTVVREVLHIIISDLRSHWSESLSGNKPKKSDFVHQTVSCMLGGLHGLGWDHGLALFPGLPWLQWFALYTWWREKACHMIHVTDITSPHLLCITALWARPILHLGPATKMGLFKCQ